DLVLFLSLVSGRNAQYLIEEHGRGVPFLKRHPVPTLSTGYILIDGGRVTGVEAVSQTRPLPADKPELAAAHATAARLIGMRAIYVDAGSGALRPVPADVIRACREAVPGLPLFVGGGVRLPEDARAARAAGGGVVVVGAAVETGGAGEAAAAPRTLSTWPRSTSCATAITGARCRRSRSRPTRRCSPRAATTSASTRSSPARSKRWPGPVISWCCIPRVARAQASCGPRR